MKYRYLIRYLLAFSVFLLSGCFANPPAFINIKGHVSGNTFNLRLGIGLIDMVNNQAYYSVPNTNSSFDYSVSMPQWSWIELVYYVDDNSNNAWDLNSSVHNDPFHVILSNDLVFQDLAQDISLSGEVILGTNVSITGLSVSGFNRVTFGQYSAPVVNSVYQIQFYLLSTDSNYTARMYLFQDANGNSMMDAGEPFVYDDPPVLGIGVDSVITNVVNFAIARTVATFAVNGNASGYSSPMLVETSSGTVIPLGNKTGITNYWNTNQNPGTNVLYFYEAFNDANSNGYYNPSDPVISTNNPSADNTVVTTNFTIFITN